LQMTLLIILTISGLMEMDWIRHKQMKKLTR
jgi:hypothetical protein